MIAELRLLGRPAFRLAVVLAASVLILASDLPAGPPAAGPSVIGGPYALLLARSTDLGPSQSHHAQLTVTLRDGTPPKALSDWANNRALSARWRTGENWAIVEGAPQDLARAFDVAVHDYRGQQGQVFYASPQQPVVPPALRGVVTALGRILGYTPHHRALPVLPPLDVPGKGLDPQALSATYNVTPLADAGFTGKGTTIVFFEFDGHDQADLDSYASMFGLPPLVPIVIGGRDREPHGETVMDLQVAHAIAPDAQKVVVNAYPTVEGDGNYEKIARLFESVDRQFPGAVWSFSIGWGCDNLLTAADLAPVQSALAAAQAHGTSAFDASGDNAGLECKGGETWSSPPGPSDQGLDAIGSLPEMTAVGGTTLSTDARGVWLAEQAWFDVPLSQGSGGGVSAIYPKPSWQESIPVSSDIPRRLSPDVSAVADPFTGATIVFGRRVLTGGGTSQSAPIWAALTAVMDQFLLANGGRLLGNLNPLLYRVAEGAARPGFHDVVLGANAVHPAAPGFDLVTGLGTPNLDNLVRNLLDLQKTPR